jgi:hypothetical protein
MITAGAGAGGSISPTGSVVVNYGNSQTFTITPNTGYHVVDVMVDSVSQGAITEYTFENVTTDHTISTSFAIDTFTITATAGENGSIDPSGSTTVSYGSDQVYTFTPADGYEVDTVTVDGQVTEVTGNNYTFMNVTDNHTIDVTFRVYVAETIWSKTYGHADWYCENRTYGLDATDDGGYVFAARSFYDASGDGDWETDFWVVKLDADGNIQWEKRFGGESLDHPESVLQTADGGYIVAGKSYSYRTGDHYCDMWVIKLNSSGGIEWQKTYGGTGYDMPNDLQETFDSQGVSSGYMLAGYTTSFGAGGYDAWVLKLGNFGTVEWEKTYGGTGNEFGRAIRQVFDQDGNPDGYVMAADTQSFGAGSCDAWVIKIDNSGTVEWEKTYGGSGLEVPQSIQVANDGGYVVSAWTDSFGAGKHDFWALKLDAVGSLVWQYTYGGSETDTAQDLEKTADGGYIMTGWTLSFGVDSFDAWVVKLSDAGHIQWQKSYNVTYTYSGDEWAYEVAQAADGGYVVAGESDAGDDRSSDVWIFKVDSAGSLGCGIETDSYSY